MSPVRSIYEVPAVTRQQETAMSSKDPRLKNKRSRPDATVLTVVVIQGMCVLSDLKTPSPGRGNANPNYAVDLAPPRSREKL
ncbi:hypothetical protein GUJ93_ZPchr0003g17328 [Zizania palustris]|uniref:Uncharacterized protein n=1 Tax=Zizania palustris TaxID=103762 RepID=A0A8J5VEC5_ZIZPA|nr:hypothetical protein GUJ93_ZPchr0003g17328 [Zizania palustris]